MAGMFILSLHKFENFHWRNLRICVYLGVSSSWILRDRVEVWLKWVGVWSMQTLYGFGVWRHCLCRNCVLYLVTHFIISGCERSVVYSSSFVVMVEQFQDYYRSLMYVLWVILSINFLLHTSLYNAVKNTCSVLSSTLYCVIWRSSDDWWTVLRLHQYWLVETNRDSWKNKFCSWNCISYISAYNSQSSVVKNCSLSALLNVHFVKEIVIW